MKQKLLLTLCLIGITALSVSCGSSSKDSSDTTPERTVLTFSISPQKTTYNPHETVVITMTKTGPEAVNALWGFSFSGSSSFPVQTATTCTIQTGASGFRMTATGRPSRTLRKDGVDMIVVSGNSTFDIRVL